MIELEFQLSIGKGRTGDFTVLLPAGLAITDPRARLSTSWLQVHTSFSAPRSVSLWRQEDRIVLAHAWQESGVDSAGRPLQRLVAYTARRPPESVLAQLLVWLYRQNFDRGPPPRHEIELAALTHDDAPLVDDERDCGAVALVLGADVCRVQSTRTAQGIVDALGFDQLGFLALVPNAVPAWPAAGPGVILSRSAWQAPADAASLVGRGLRSDSVDLSGLMRMPCDPARRKTLMIAGLTGDCADLGELSDQELPWLLAQTPTRPRALSRATAGQIASLVAASTINLDELENLAPHQLSRLPLTVLVSALRGSPDAVGRFVAAVGAGVDGVEDLLPPRAAELARARHGPVSDPERILDLTRPELELMQQAGVFQTMSFRWLTAFRSFSPRFANQHLDDRLRGMLPEPLASRLLGRVPGDVDEAIVLVGNPPEPRAEWLAGIDYQRLVEAGLLCVRDRAWRHWWTEALRVHPASQGCEIATPSAPWSRETAAWLSASARDGEISAACVRDRIAAFLTAGAPIEPRGLVELLTAAGITRAAEMALVVRGEAPLQGRIDQRMAVELKDLLASGILTTAALEAARRSGLPVATLSGLAADEAAVGLIDPRSLAPARIPASWHPFLTCELRRQIPEAAFWKRWPHGVPKPLLLWMGEQVKGEAEESIVDELLAASDRVRVLGWTDLVRVSGGLAPLDLAWQLIEHARSARDRGKLLALLEDGRLRTELVVLLRSELGTLAAGVPVPDLSVPELIALHSLLDPVRDVVRQVMSHPVAQPGEDVLLERTVAAIRRIAHAFPPAPPSAEQAARRPAWVRALSELPGWEHWRCVTVAESLP